MPIHEPRRSPPQLARLDLMLQRGKLLFANGQTTEKVVFVLKELATAGGFRATIFAEWGELRVRLGNGVDSYSETIAVEPAGVDIGKVSTTISLIHQVCQGKMDLATADPRYKKFLKPAGFIGALLHRLNEVDPNPPTLEIQAYSFRDRSSINNTVLNSRYLP